MTPEAKHIKFTNGRAHYYGKNKVIMTWFILWNTKGDILTDIFFINLCFTEGQTGLEWYQSE